MQALFTSMDINFNITLASDYFRNINIAISMLYLEANLILPLLLLLLPNTLQKKGKATVIISTAQLNLQGSGGQ